MAQNLKVSFQSLKFKRNSSKILSRIKIRSRISRKIKINLSDINVEAYNFYRDQEKAYVIDFWNDQDNDALIPKKDIKTAPVTKINKKINKKVIKKRSKLLKKLSSKNKKSLKTHSP